MISSYLGGGSAFDQAVAAFASSYAGQVRRDYDVLAAAVQAGRIEVVWAPARGAPAIRALNLASRASAAARRAVLTLVAGQGVPCKGHDCITNDLRTPSRRRSQVNGL